MLYQVATSQLPPADVAFSLRKGFLRAENVDLKLAEAVSIDPAARAVAAKTGAVYPADYLALAAGSHPSFFRTPGAERHTFPLYARDPSGGFFPQLGSVVLQAGQRTAGNILADIAGKPRTPFPYHDKGIITMWSFHPHFPVLRR
jgi:NADH dehydrogenase